MILARPSEATVTVYRHDLLNLLGYAMEGKRPPGELYMRLRSAVDASLAAEPPDPALDALRHALDGGGNLTCDVCQKPVGMEPYGIELPSGRVTHDECQE